MESFLNALSGLGLFLLGMITMTEGLRALAGDKMRTALMRFTRSPTSGAISGMISTAILQSSSATTVAAVSFVAAGLLTFQQSLGIILGANIGTTATGWLVTLLGFKLHLGTLVLPLIFLGALMRLFGKKSTMHIGLALAGFGLIFVGIDMLQQGMHTLQSLFTFTNFPADTFFGRIQLVFLGLLFTIITQSSGAGVAVTLSALYSGVVNFQQAASLVIGMDIGTTVTAFIATIGASVAARRTGYSHVIYNLMTGTLALLVLTPYTFLLKNMNPHFIENNAEISLVTFHTSFNILGVSLVLPFSRYFAKMIEHLVPEAKPKYTSGLDMTLLSQPKTALSVAQASVKMEFRDLVSHALQLVNPKTDSQFPSGFLKNELNETQRYIDLIEIDTSKPEWHTLLNLIFATDHMIRLQERCEEQQERAVAAAQSKTLKPYLTTLIDNFEQILLFIDHNQWEDAKSLSQKTRSEIKTLVQPYRAKVINDIGSGELEIPEGTRKLEAIRWLSRVSKHLNKIIQHLTLSYSHDINNTA